MSIVLYPAQLHDEMARRGWAAAVHSEEIQVGEGMNSLSIDNLDGLPAGIYYALLSNKAEKANLAAPKFDLPKHLKFGREHT